jgi:hypothetical protein
LFIILENTHKKILSCVCPSSATPLLKNVCENQQMNDYLLNVWLNNYVYIARLRGFVIQQRNPDNHININIWLFGGQLFPKIHRLGLGNIRVLVRFNTSLCRVPIFRKFQCRPRVASLAQSNQSQVQLTGAPNY